MTAAASNATCPRFFEDLCEDKSLDDRERYVEAGRQLARRMGEMRPADTDAWANDDWAEALVRLAEFIRSGDKLLMVDWLERHLPGCMGIVPANRLESVQAGFCSTLIEEGIDLLQF